MLLLQLLLPLLPGLQLLNCHMEAATPVAQAPSAAVADLLKHGRPCFIAADAAAILTLTPTPTRHSCKLLR
jgi:hypothetical protein